MLLTNTQVCKAFANNPSANIKSSKTQLHKIGQSGGFLGRLLGPLLKTGLSLIRNVLKPLSKSVLIPLGLRAASSTNAAIHKKILGSSYTKLMILNKEVNDIMKIVKSIEESKLLTKGVSKQSKNETEEQKGGFLRMLLCTLRAGLFGNL